MEDSSKKKKIMEEDDGISMFSLLPEGCISHIVSLTSPKDACRSSAVSWGFRSASESDTVWEQFLPEDYREIISNSVPPINYSTKKELFFHLCQFPILLYGGTLSFWLNKSSGKKCYMLCARELSIAWKDNPRYWNWTSIAETRFCEVAELLDVCRLDIVGKMQTKMLSTKTDYAAYLVFKTVGNNCGLDCVMTTSVRFINSSNGDECDTVYLSRRMRGHQLIRRRRWRLVVEQRTQCRLPVERNDGWMEICLGKFFNDEGDNEIEMRLSETGNFYLKRGLIIEGIEVRPMEDS